MNKFIEVINDMVEIITGEKLEDPEIKRARGKMGKFLADDKSTEYTNEAWVGGKAPTRVKTIGYKKRKKNVKS